MIKSTKGFTLLEILIVLVILAVVAGLAVPAYQTTVEKSRGQEALMNLSATREAMTRYYAINSTYVNATIPLAGGGTLDFNPNVTAGGQVRIFDYTLSNLGAATFTITATRNGINPGGTIAINQAGTVTRTGVYA